MGEKIFVADKETQNQIKQDTTAILEELRGQRPKRYGYRVKITEPNPADRVEYLFDAVGMTPAHMDFDTGTFNYGDWKDIWFVRDNYPCMVRSSGAEDYRLNPNDYTKKLADGADSDVLNQQYDGNAMAAIPLVWVCRYQESGYRYVIFCESQYDESYKAYAHTRPDGTIAKNAYHALFEGTIVETKLRSLAGDGLYPQNITQASAELTAAKANGTNWSIRTWSVHTLIADLCTLISKSCNSQEAFGQGHTTGYVNNADQHYGLLNCGTLKDKGQFYGYNDTAHAVKVFHIENFWGNRWDRILGLVLDNGVPKAKMTPEGAGYNLTGDGYTAFGTGVSGETAEYGSGYQHLTEQTEFGCLPVGPHDGSDATYETDHYWWNRTAVRVALAGGACPHGACCGARCLHLNHPASGAVWDFGASLTLENPS